MPLFGFLFRLHLFQTPVRLPFLPGVPVNEDECCNEPERRDARDDRDPRDAELEIDEPPFFKISKVHSVPAGAPPPDPRNGCSPGSAGGRHPANLVDQEGDEHETLRISKLSWFFLRGKRQGKDRQGISRSVREALVRTEIREKVHSRASYIASPSFSHTGTVTPARARH